MPTTFASLRRRLTDLVAPRRRGRTTSANKGVAPASPAAYPGDATALPDLAYAPKLDGKPDPGEIVWTWVPYEEDHTQGKDRPVLLIGRQGRWLIGLQLTSKDHDRDEEQERRAGREWVDIGSGTWDGKGRASEVRVNRLIRIDPGKVRREGAVLARDRYEQVTVAVRRHYPR
jgi:hypothetical protein